LAGVAILVCVSPYDVRLDSILSPMTVACLMDESLEEVAARMRRSDVGSVLVVNSDDSDEIIGILTERDIVRAIADGAHPSSTLVGDYMTAETTTATPDTNVMDAARTMVSLGIRHLPVVAGGKSVGVVSLRDVLIELLP
jgi:CBS domain-containing protein